MDNTPDWNKRYKSKNKVVVITGASSGIGRAAAHEFARRGYIVVASSRNKNALDEVVNECHGMGSEALAVVADVTREEDVNNLARTTVEKYGHLDIWVNNAAVTMFGRFEEVPTENIRQVVETNLFGYIYGARAAISRFREQGRGTLINVSSIVAVTGQPYTGAYVATKAAERSLSESLRQELMDEKNIHVCVVMPAVTDTPIFQHGANYTGKQIVAPSPVNSAQMVAEVIVDISENPKKEVFAGSPGSKASMAKALTPAKMFDKKIKKNTEKHHFSAFATDPSPGNLYDYYMDQVDGGWLLKMNQKESSSPNTIMMAGLFVAGFSLAFLAIWGYRKSLKNRWRKRTYSITCRPDNVHP